MVDVILRQRRFYFLFNILPLYRVLLERLIVNRPQHWGLLDHFHRADQDPNIQVAILRVCSLRPREPEPIPICSEELHGGHGQPASTE